MASFECERRTCPGCSLSSATSKAKRRIDRTRIHGRVRGDDVALKGSPCRIVHYDRREGGLTGGIASLSRRLCVTANTSCPGRTFWQLPP